MPKIHQTRAGSLQFWPRKKAAKLLPSVNWSALSRKHAQKKGLLGFVGYKVGMIRALAQDLTPDSLTKNKQIVLPLTLIECPVIRILSVRLYKNSRVKSEIFADIPEKDIKRLKRKIRLPKTKKKFEKEKFNELEKKLDEIDDIRIIIYTNPTIKKTPDIAEIGIAGSISDKLNFVKQHLDKGIKIEELFEKNQLIDIRGVTKGYGFTGPVKRFGIGLRQKKSEKGRRRPGTLGAWTPSRVTFRAPMAGQHGFFTRAKYNLKLLDVGSGNELKKFEKFIFPRYGKIKTAYIAVKGSVQGPAKRQLLITLPLRGTKRRTKEVFEIINLVK